MAKGSYRKKRLKVLAELQEHDPLYAQQLIEMRATEPQAFRKAILKVDVELSAKFGRPVTLSMRPKRFGGDEDPVLVRRVQELRQAHREREQALRLQFASDQAASDRERRASSLRGESEVDDALDDDALDDDDLEQSAEAMGEVYMQHPTPPLPSETLRSEIRDVKMPQRHTPPGVGDGGFSQGEAERTLEPPVRARQGGRDHGEVPVTPRVTPKKAVAKKAVVKKAPAASTQSAASMSAAAPDLSVLKGAVGKLKAALASGSFDAHLTELLAAEKAGKARKGALVAIKARMG
ncbi:MAG: hypothetical protein ACI9MC_003506 [Kiritimatiellia bacterium]|jgi:hypothetical protein